MEGYNVLEALLVGAETACGLAWCGNLQKFFECLRLTRTWELSAARRQQLAGHQKQFSAPFSMSTHLRDRL